MCRGEARVERSDALEGSSPDEGGRVGNEVLREVEAQREVAQQPILVGGHAVADLVSPSSMMRQ